jgi:bla regulator protein BlaR1
MILYLLKSAGCLALLLLFYHLVLEKEKMHNFNRYYLLIGILFSFLAPLVTFTTYIKKTIVASTKIVESPFIRDLNSMNIQENYFDYSQLIIGIYLIISSVFLIRFGLNLFEITRKINKNEKVKYLSAVLVLVDDEILPHSFWNYIFINKEEYTNGNIEEELFTHELTHVTQKHTFDVLLIELLQAVFWINPLFIFLKKAIQLNHEFLADENVIIKHKNTLQYQHLLLNKATWNNEYYLATNLNYSLTKKRLKMMTTESSRSLILLKKFAVIPLLTGFIFLFAERVEAQEKIEVQEIVEENNSEREKTIKQQEEAASKNLTTKEQLTIVEDFRLQSLKKSNTTSSEEKINTGFDYLNDVKHYYVTVNGKTKYYNKEGKQTNNEGIPISLKKANSNNIIPGNYVTKIYTNGSVFCEFLDNRPKKIMEKRYIDSPIKPIEEQSLKRGDIRLKLKDVNGLKISYSKKDTDVKTTTKGFENFVKKTNNPLDVYKRKNNYYEEDRQKEPHFVKRSKRRQKQLNDSFSELGSLYFKLSKADKKKAKRPIHPHDPYLKLEKNNKVFYRLRSALTAADELLIPPPPPVPNASKEEILKAKKAFLDWKKRTGNDLPTPPPPRKN